MALEEVYNSQGTPLLGDSLSEKDTHPREQEPREEEESHVNCGADCALINYASKYVSLLIHCTSLFFSGKMDHHVDRLVSPCTKYLSGKNNKSLHHWE